MSSSPDPFVSVVIPAYNAEPYLATTLRSILDQTFGDFEVIVLPQRSQDLDDLHYYPVGEDRLFATMRKEHPLAAGEADGGKACQLHSQWLAQRPGTFGLLQEYARSALRPTVAFPYPLLLVLAVLLHG